MIVPKQLISLLNSGRCIAIIGAGPSCEIGYPTWLQLASHCLEIARNDGIPLDEPMFARLIKNCDCLRVFKYLEQHFTRSKLAAIIQSQLPACTKQGRTYGILSKWPFRFYMTTNWDNCLYEHLSRIGHHFSVVGNGPDIITQITDETTKQIIMLHGEFSDINSLVITEDDYQAFRVGSERSYFRETLKSILRTLPAVVIGHSMTDPDIQIVLEAAKTIAPSHRPIYMIVGDPLKEDVDSFRHKYNIHLVGYKRDDRFSHFSKLLRSIDRFVVPRTGSVVRPLEQASQQDIEIATSLLVYNSLSKTLGSSNLLDRFIYPQILQMMKRGDQPIHKNDVRSALLPEPLRTYPATLINLESAFQRLEADDCIFGSDNDGWKLTEAGERHVAATSATQRFEDDQVYGSLKGILKKSGVSQGECDKAAQSLKSAIMSVFRKRGIAAASLVFAGKTFEPMDMAELFESVSESVEWAESFELREAYMDFSVRLFSSPTPEERRYLARVSQGMFAVHVFGIDPTAIEARAEVFKAVSWFLDSNVLIHLLAVGSAYSDMASSLCQKCKQLGIRLFASRGVIAETFNSLDWAARMCQSLRPHEEMQFIYSVFNEESGYRQNPYIDGYVACHHKEGVKRFADYQTKLGIFHLTDVATKLKEAGVIVTELRDLPSSDQLRQSHGDFKAEILEERERRRTSRGSGGFQAEVEAEVLCLILAKRRDKIADLGASLESAYFVSTSRLLDHMFKQKYGTLTWLPDMLFKHLSLISPSSNDAVSLIESLGTELADLGVTLVDNEAYRRYFDPLICSSRMSFEAERTKFVETLQEENAAAIEDLQHEFDATPDLSKPFFVTQMHWKLGAKNESKLELQLGVASRERSELAEKLIASELEWEARQKATVQQFENRIRNLSDPTRREKLKRKAKNKSKRRKKGK